MHLQLPSSSLKKNISQKKEVDSCKTENLISEVIVQFHKKSALTKYNIAIMNNAKQINASMSLMFETFFFSEGKA